MTDIDRANFHSGMLRSRDQRGQVIWPTC